jgi:hypothetical protein
MNRKVLTLVLSLLVVALDTQAAESETHIERFSGVARSTSGAVVYRETHEVTYQGDRPQTSVTRYFDPSGKPIGQLYSDYRKDPFAPDYTFKDAKGVTREAAENLPSGLRLRYRGESKLIARSEIEGRVVTGQGLHQLARAKIDALASGKEMVVDFAIPSRMDTYRFRIERMSAGSNTVKLKIAIDNWLLGIVAPTLEVEYDRRNKRLVAYRGVSNLDGPDGDTMTVNISYSYPEASTAKSAPAGKAAQVM